jgi:hypothetical protein
MNSNLLSKSAQLAVGALILSVVLPVAALAQRRWGERPHRGRIVVSNYQRSFVVYQRRPRYSDRSFSYGAYGYPQGYYGTQYSTYGPTGTSYTNRYHSYRNSQPYFANRYTYAWANRYTYAWANPTYRYDESWYRQRRRRSGLRMGIRLR